MGINSLIKRQYLCLIVVAGIFMLLSPAAFADGADTEGAIRNQLLSVVSVIRTCAMPFAVVGFAGSAVSLITSGSDASAASKAVKRMIVIALALGAIWLLPEVIRIGSSLAASSVWNPEYLS